METTIEVASLDHLVTEIAKVFAPLAVDRASVVAKPYTFDERIGLDTYIVTVDGAAIGFTDGPLV